MNTYGGVEVQLPSLTSAVAGGELLVSQPSHSTSRNTVHSTYSTGSWVGPRTGLDTLEKLKISIACWESKQNSLEVQTIAWSLYQLHYPAAVH